MKRIILLISALVMLNGLLVAQDAIRKKHFNLQGGIGIQGYDPVSYFQGKPIKGSKDLALYHQGITYYFASAANKEAFKTSPAKYEPEYGGWCAYAMGEKGEKVSVDPKTYKIVNNRLYLFYNKLFNNTLTDWNKDEARLKNQADVNWQKTYH